MTLWKQTNCTKNYTTPGGAENYTRVLSGDIKSFFICLMVLAFLALPGEGGKVIAPRRTSSLPHHVCKLIFIQLRNLKEPTERIPAQPNPAWRRSWFGPSFRISSMCPNRTFTQHIERENHTLYSKSSSPGWKKGGKVLFHSFFTTQDDDAADQDESECPTDCMCEINFPM